MSTSAGLLSRLLAFALCLEALVAVMARHPQPILVPLVRDAKPPVGTAKSAGWVVRVDGWTLGVDEAAKGSLARLLAPRRTRPPLQSVALDSAALPFLDLVVSTAQSEGLDWRLVMAIIAEESGFNPNSRSEAGAYGLMQVRSIAAREVDEPEFRTPSANVRTGVRYLKHLMVLFPVPDPNQQLGIVLAAYNMGPAHVADAQLLAEKYGLSPARWYDSVEVVLPLLEQPAVYGQLANGYAKGRQTVRYVRRVLERYERLRQMHRLPAQLVHQAN